MKLSAFVAKLSKKISAELVGADIEVVNFSTDSRALRGGELFIALSGANFNGNAFAAAAVEAGAAAVVVSEKNTALHAPQIIVSDTHAALGEIASAWREQFHLTRVAITGSSGKTTTKELTASIFSEVGNTLATLGNKNNDIGVPLTLFRLNAAHQYGVFELGANHIGEIAYTSAMVQPHAAVITNIGSAHLEGFGSREGIAQAKAEIFTGVVSGGVACINEDDEFAAQFHAQCAARQQHSPLKVLTFSQHKKADIYASHIHRNVAGCPAFTLHIGEQSQAVELQLIGQHNIANALAAAALAHACAIPLQKIALGLAKTQPVTGRLNVHVLAFKQHSCRLIDDTYNANPSSVKAAIDVLADLSGRRVLVLGAMGELGEAAQASHFEVGEYARMKKIDALYTVGNYSSFTAAGFGANAHCHAEQKTLIEDLEKELEGVVSLLVKGSRSAQMETVVNGLRDFKKESQ